MKNLSRLLAVIMLGSCITTTQAISPINKGLIVLAASAAVGITTHLSLNGYDSNYLEESLEEEENYCAQEVRRLKKELAHATAKYKKYQALIGGTVFGGAAALLAVAFTE